MNKRLPFFFFGLSFFFALVWGSTELILSFGKPDAAGGCRFDGASEFDLSGHELLARSGKVLATFRRQSESLEWMRLTNDPAKPLLPEFEPLPLRCETPDYNCFPAQKSGGFENLRVFSLQGEFGLVDAVKDGQRRVVPISIHGQKLHLANPVKVCGDTPSSDDPESYSYHDGKLSFFDAGRGLLGIWRIQGFNGTMTQAAAREPDEIYRIDAQTGFQRGSCDENGTVPPARAVFAGPRALLLWKSPEGTKIRSYRIDPGLAPDETTQAALMTGDRVFAIDGLATAIASESQEKMQILRSDAPPFSQWEFRSGEPLERLSWTDDRRLAKLSARYFWRGLRARLVSPDRTEDLGGLSGFRWIRNIPNFTVLPIDPTHALWAWQDGKDVRFRSFACSEPSTVQEDDADKAGNAVVGD